MKFFKNNLQKITTFILISVFVFTACNKDVDVVDDFDFELTTTFAEAGFVNEQESLVLSIIPEKEDTTTKYFFSFEVANGTGTFETAAGTIIESGQSHAVEISKSETLAYLPTTVGTHQITIKVKNSHNIEKTAELNYEVSQSDFTFTAQAESTGLTIGQTTPINFEIIELETSTDVYELQYEFISGNAKLFNGIELLIPSEFYELSQFTFNWLFEATEIGSIETKFTLKNANTGVIKTANIVIEVTNPCDFIFETVAFEGSDAIVGIAHDIDFEIDHNINANCNEDYIMTYQVKLDGNPITYGIFEYEGTGYAHGDNITIEPENFTGQFITNGATGNYEVTFAIANSLASQPLQTKATSKVFENPPITMVITPDANTVFAKQDAAYGVDLSGGGSGGFEVKVIPDAANLGSTLKIDGNDSNFDEFKPVPDSSNIVLTPNEVGTATFTVIAQKNGETKTETITLISEKPEFTVNDLVLDDLVIDDSEGETTTLRVNITLLNGYSENLTYTYEVFGSITSNPSIISDVPGDPIPNEQEFTISSAGFIGIKTIDVKVTNQYGFFATKSIDIEIVE